MGLAYGSYGSQCSGTVGLRTRGLRVTVHDLLLIVELLTGHALRLSRGVLAGSGFQSYIP